MRASPYVICLWPGLPRLWIRGDWTALAVAIAFGVAFNFVVVFSLVWPRLFPAPWLAAGWISLALAWVVSAYRGWRALSQLREPPARDDRGLFIQAQAEYLKGHWFEAEMLLRKLLRECRRDVDALLMLATLYRRTRRYDEAAKQLEILKRFEEAKRWHAEIERECRVLQRLTASRETESHAAEPGIDRSLQEPEQGSKM